MVPVEYDGFWRRKILVQSVGERSVRRDELVGLGKNGFFEFDELVWRSEIAEGFAFRMLLCRVVELFLQQKKWPTNHEDVVSATAENTEFGEMWEEILADDEVLNIGTKMTGVGFCETVVAGEESFL